MGKRELALGGNLAVEQKVMVSVPRAFTHNFVGITSILDSTVLSDQKESTLREEYQPGEACGLERMQDARVKTEEHRVESRCDDGLPFFAIAKMRRELWGI